jgi:hypothetical protein
LSTQTGCWHLAMSAAAAELKQVTVWSVARAEPAYVGALCLISYRLIRELSADRLIALKGGE